MPFSVNYQKYLKLGQCLNIDDMASPSEFGDVTRPNLHFTGYSVRYRAAYNMRARSPNLPHSPNLLGDVMSSISRH